MALPLRKARVALGLALIASGGSATTTLAASPTTISYTSNVLSIRGGAGTTNVIGVSDNGAGTFRVLDVGGGATLAAGPGVSVVAVSSANTWSITTTGPVSKVVVDGADLRDALNTKGLTIRASLIGGDGDDILNSGNIATTFWGGPGDDSSTGGSGNDTFAGDTGQDAERGGAGNDTFFERDGFTDKIDGGLGNDTAHVDTELSILGIETVLFS